MTHEIFMLISWTLGIFILVEAGSSTRAGASATAGCAHPKQVHGHTVLEIAWTIAFAVILLIIASPPSR